jgi:hypothetical protein
MADDTISGVAAEADVVAAELAELASALTAARQEAATRLQAEVSAELVELAMPHAVVTVRVGSAGGLGPDGADEVEFLLAPNAGSPARPLGKGASGGELSRVMLALEVVLAATAPVPTFVFDEVDAGSAAGPPSRWVADWRGCRSTARCWWSPTCLRSQPSPTGTTSSTSPRTGPSPPAACMPWTTTVRSASCRGCSPVSKARPPPPHTP